MDLIHCTSQNCPYISSCQRAQPVNDSELLPFEEPIYYNYEYECSLSDGFSFYIKAIYT